MTRISESIKAEVMSALERTTGPITSLEDSLDKTAFLNVIFEYSRSMISSSDRNIRRSDNYANTQVCTVCLLDCGM